MKFKGLIITFVLIFAMVSVPTLAQEEDGTDVALLATEGNYPDAVVGSSVSEKLGVPVFLTETEQIDEEVLETIDDYGPDEIVVLGGPEVISESVVNDLDATGYEVDRVWGMSRYGTAQEVVDRFWPEGSEEVTLIEDELDQDRSDVMAQARSVAQDRPLIPVPEGKVPAVVLNQLDEMDTESVTFIGTELSEEVVNDLNDLGIDVDEEIVGEDIDGLRENVRDRVRENVSPEDRLLVVASRGRSDAISASYVPGKRPIVVSDADEIDELVEIVEDNEVEEVMLVGNPELASEIEESLNEMDIEIDMVVDRAVTAIEQSTEVARGRRPDFVEAHQQKSEQWRNRIEERQEKVMERTEKELERARGLFDDWNGPELEEKLSQAEEAIENNEYQSAREMIQRIRTESRNRRYAEINGDRQEFANEVRREMADLSERTQEIRELNEEFADMMQENMTVNERLETIENFRGRRQERISEMVGDFIEEHNVTEELPDFARNTPGRGR